ncbi:MAG: glycogen debranching protein GlgX [Gammaproteobacteria bacterium]
MDVDVDYIDALPGLPGPLGATVVEHGVNFALYSATAQAVELCLFREDGKESGRVRVQGRSGDVWHALVPGIRPGQRYGYRVHGRYAPDHGYRFNEHKLLIDPYARCIKGAFEWRPEVFAYTLEKGHAWQKDARDSAPWMPHCVVADPEFDWQGVQRPMTPWNRSVIYELHVKGFTRLHPEVPEPLRGTYLGLAEPAVLNYLQRLGVTAVELMPCQAFLSEDRLTGMGLSNYWGYNPIAMFAPHPDYALEDPVDEFRRMVRALHGAGIEVILDVVFNHTAEGGEGGPLLSFRGIDNHSYYLLDPENPAPYVNFSGCGNTLDVSNPATLRLVTDCLRHWATDMQIDGFRFDLAPTLARRGAVFERGGAFFGAVFQDPVLSQLKLIAEPWDIGPAGYRLGHFPPPWAEWNDRYRETLRQFWRGDAGKTPEFAERIAGSSDFFRTPGRQPAASVNYAACHDGFTLADVVSYSRKHNEANGEANNDGSNHGSNWNCGEEGVSSDPRILSLRRRLRRNMLATLLLSQGTPMLQAGDEFGRTQGGNNNAYCQDNEISWVDWSLVGLERELQAFVSLLIRLRLAHPVFRRESFLDGMAHPESALKDVTWLDADGSEMSEDDWRAASRQVLGVLLDHTGVRLSHRLQHESGAGDSFLMLFNAGARDIDFTVPAPISSEIWEVVFDTSEEGATVPASGFREGNTYTLQARSMVLLADRG